MSTKKPLKKKRVKNTSPLKKLQKGRIREKQLFVIIGVLILIVGAVFFMKPWQYLSTTSLPFMSKAIAVTKPGMDFARARQMTIDPEKDNIMQIMTREQVRVTLEIPKGAVKEKTIVKMIPFAYDPNKEAPTAGVIVGPANVNFSQPVTLSFNLADSKFKNNAPKNAIDKKIRTTGNSQVLQINSAGTTLTPTLIARGIEIENYLPARILTGGAYVFSIDGKNQVEIAKKALASPNMHTLTVMESATTALFNDQQLNPEEVKKTKAAVAKILSKPSPPAHELLAALILQKKLTNKSFSLVPKAFAYETGEGFYQAVCRDDRYSVEEYLGFAKAAQLMGHDNIGESCLNKAKNKVAEDAQKVLAGNPDLKSIMVALQNVLLVGLESETNLEGRLLEKAKEVATEGAKKVAENPNSTALEAAIEMQKMESVGADQGPTYEQLKQKITDVLDKQDAAAEKATEEYQRDEAKREADLEKLSEEAEKEEERLSKEYEGEAIQQEEIMESAAMSALGIGMLKAFGFDELDKESLKKKFDEMQSQTVALNEATYTFCVEMRAEGIETANCEEEHAKVNGLIKEAEAASYRAQEEIGNLQSQEFEEPEYQENNGEYEMYFEEEITPTPGSEEGSEELILDENYEESPEETGTYDEQSNTYYEDYGAEGQSIEEEPYQESSEESYSEYDSGVNSSSEEVQGMSTKKSEPNNWFSWWPL